MKVTYGAVLPLPADEAFAFVADPVNWPLFFPGRQAVEKDDDWGRVGGHARLTSIILGRAMTMTIELTEWDPPRAFRYTVSRDGGPANDDNRRTFQPVHEGTRLIGTTEIPTRRGPAGWLDRLQMTLARRIFVTAMTRLPRAAAASAWQRDAVSPGDADTTDTGTKATSGRRPEGINPMATSPFQYRRDLRAAHVKLAALPSRTADLPVGPVEYLDDGQGPPVLLIHGIFGGHDAALRLADPSDLAGRRRVAPSRFGYLGTVMPPEASVALQADTHAALLDALAIDQAAVVAGSAGTTSALELAVRHPDRVTRLVLLSSNAPGPHHDTNGIPEWLARRLWASDPLMWTVRTYAPRSISSLMGVPPDLPLSADDRARLEEELDSIFPVSRRVRGCLFDAFTSNKAINTIPLEQVHAPSLVIHFRDDTGAPFAGAQTLARRIPHAESLFLDHGGHLGLGEHPELSATLRTFLQEVLPTD